MSTKVARSTVQQIKPLLSSNKEDAKERVLKLYKAWYRQIPIMIHEFDLPVDEKQARAKLREKFLQNKHVTDMRAIDMLVIKGQQDLLETANKWAQSCHVYKWFEDMEPTPRPTDFLSKFIDGHDP